MTDHRQVVADEEIGQTEFVLQVAHQVQDLRLHGDVERRRRLIANDELGIGRKRARDRDALALSAGKFVRIFAAVVGMQSDQSQEFSDPVPDLALALYKVEGADRLGDDVVNPKTRIETRIGVLKDHLDAAPQAPAGLRLSRVGHRDTVDHDVAGGRRQQADHHARDRRLAGAGFADQRKRLALPNVEGHAVNGFEVLEVAALDDAVQPGLGDVEGAPKVFDVDEAHAALSLTVS